MKRKLAVILVLVLVVSFSILFVSCDTNKSNSKAEYVKDGDYIKIWYDEAWFPNFIHIELFYGEQLVDVESGYNLRGQRLSTSHNILGFAPNTWVYFFYPDIDNYNYIILKVCKDNAHNDNGCEVLAEYTISIK